MESDDAGRGNNGGPRFAQHLITRFAMVLALSLLPLGIISLLQTRDLQAEMQGRADAALLGATLRTAAREIGQIRFSQGIVAALAADPDLLDNPAACAAKMRNAAERIPDATLVAFMPKSGMMTCSSNGRTFDFSDSALFQSVLAAQKPHFVVNRNGPVSGTSVLGISHPLFADTGEYLGYVSISLPHATLEAQRSIVADMPNPLLFWTFDREGTVLTASSGLDRVGPQLPRNIPLKEFVGQPAQVVQDVSNAGVSRTYAVTPLADDELYLMSSWDEDAESLLESIGYSRYVPPIIMWAVGLLVAGWASERLVARHIRVLTLGIQRFAAGDRSLQQLDLSTAPVELREAGNAFLGMTETIMLGEAHLEDNIHQKEVLLREVHHRVKNNLQLIASIMNIQMRKASSAETRILLSGLQNRVMSLATIHRGLYQTSGLADVHADELLTDIVRQIINMGSRADHRIALDIDIDDLRLIPDQAVPLSLFLTEAVTNALKYAGARPGAQVRIGVRLKRAGGKAAIMEVSNSLAGKAADDVDPQKMELNTQSTGLGEQLLAAFAQQIGGQLTRKFDDDAFQLTLRFDVTHLSEAENRVKPA